MGRPKRRTGWTILIVPPNPLRPTRALRIRRRHVRAAIITAALCAAALLGLGTIVAADSIQVMATADQLADAHNMILSLTDSLRSMEDIGSGDEDAPAAAVAKMAAAHGTRTGSRTGPARQTVMGLAQPSPGIVLPVIGQITSRFSRSRWHPILGIFRPHKGVDVAAPRGTSITAPAAGRVVFVGRRLGDGLMVELDHGEGVRSRYAHCSSVKVKEGDFVSFGDVIATVGSSGLSTGPHVHFEVLVRGRPVDPLRYLIHPSLAPRQAGAPAPALTGAREEDAPAPTPTAPPTVHPAGSAAAPHEQEQQHPAAVHPAPGDSSANPIAPTR